MIVILTSNNLSLTQVFNSKATLVILKVRIILNLISYLTSFYSYNNDPKSFYIHTLWASSIYQLNDQACVSVRKMVILIDLLVRFAPPRFVWVSLILFSRPCSYFYGYQTISSDTEVIRLNVMKVSVWWHHLHIINCITKYLTKQFLKFLVL